MKVLVLAGGYGTRLYPLVKDTPKALLDINGKPIVHHIIDRVTQIDNVEEILIVTNDKFYSQILAWAEKQSSSAFKIKVFNDGTMSNEDRLGSIGDINFVVQQDQTDTDMLVVGGDNLFDFDLNEYSRFAQQNAPSVTIGVFDIENIDEANKFGVVQLDSAGKVISFEEKPEKPKSSLIAMCFLLFTPSIFRFGQQIFE